MYTAAAKSWVHFSEEFRAGGMIASLDKSQKDQHFIPSTNDISESMLGTKQVHL
jgi:hypothetical protein